MSKVRVLVGTRKGAFVLTSDGKRERWDVSGPFFAGWETYHMKGSPADPNRLYASQTSGWFGQIIQRSDDGGKTWTQPGSARPTAGSTGRNSPDCAATARGRAGSQEPAGCACTRFFWTRAIPSGFISPSRPQAHSVRTMAARPGGPSTRDSIPNIFPNPLPRWATAFTA